MKVSTKGRYALRLMVDLARHGGMEHFVALKDISQRQGVSVKYLEQIVSQLYRAEFLRSARGPQGGYMLAIDPTSCTAGDILRAVEGSLAPVTCLMQEDNQCPRKNICGTLGFWVGLDEVINKYVDATTLADIVERGKHLPDGEGACIN